MKYAKSLLFNFCWDIFVELYSLMIPYVKIYLVIIMIIFVVEFIGVTYFEAEQRKRLLRVIMSRFD